MLGLETLEDGVDDGDKMEYIATRLDLRYQSFLVVFCDATVGISIAVSPPLLVMRRVKGMRFRVRGAYSARPRLPQPIARDLATILVHFRAVQCDQKRAALTSQSAIQPAPKSDSGHVPCEQ